jgi:hypothetical protein
MTTELKELKNIILAMDEMIGHWFDGTRPDGVECEECPTISIYEIADNCRNRALEILEEMENKG